MLCLLKSKGAWIYEINLCFVWCNMLYLLGQRSNLTYLGITHLVVSFDSIPIVLVPWDRFSLYHTSIRPILAFQDHISILIVGCVTTLSGDSQNYQITITIIIMHLDCKLNIINNFLLIVNRIHSLIYNLTT